MRGIHKPHWDACLDGRSAASRAGHTVVQPSLVSVVRHTTNTPHALQRRPPEFITPTTHAGANGYLGNSRIGLVGVRILRPRALAWSRSLCLLGSLEAVCPYAALRSPAPCIVPTVSPSSFSLSHIHTSPMPRLPLSTPHPHTHCCHCMPSTRSQCYLARLWATRMHAGEGHTNVRGSVVLRDGALLLGVPRFGGTYFQSAVFRVFLDKLRYVGLVRGESGLLAARLEETQTPGSICRAVAASDMLNSKEESCD
ncbi:hypothetical protein HYPSUDRAFT_203633 [Hypholoma sublateritium FD-334 SS-4]|uniref:Uncharacterized protein n=1 Tax=Hypholoma sublateritium (strain FD-334 SS-4) TaxID=945553 RepID=A0A0D2NVY2_HYPSF|nr:hypothetical protein HYPSUDRAFT_203633 [Hypholoma sublateritium FD-334 SS-4]